MSRRLRLATCAVDLAQGRLRAIEQGLPMVRSANTGISAMIDGRGRLLATLPLGEAGQITHVLPPPEAPTLYARLGDWPVLGLILLALFATGLGRRNYAVDAGAKPS